VLPFDSSTYKAEYLPQNYSTNSQKKYSREYPAL